MGRTEESGREKTKKGSHEEVDVAGLIFIGWKRQ
jgi:hypothetical protein